MTRGTAIQFVYHPFIQRSEQDIPLQPYNEEDLRSYILNMVALQLKSKDNKEVIQSIIDDLKMIYENG